MDAPAGSLPGGPGDRRPQEQLRRQGQLLRLPRELPHGPVGAVQPDRHPRHRPLRHPPDLHRRGQGGQRGDRRRASRTCPTSSASGPTSSRRRSGSRPRSSGPIVNTRDEPHADAQKYRRLHVIVGDANLSEVATFLKVGTTALVLAMVEDDFLPRDFVFRTPVQAMRQVSYDTVADPAARAGRRHHRHRARGAVGAARPGPQVRRRPRPRRSSARRSGADVLAPLGAGAHRARDRSRRRWPASSTGWPSAGSSTATASATAPRGTTPGSRPWPCSTTTSGRSAASPPGPGSSGSPTTPRSSGPAPSRPRTPGRTSGAGASRSSPTSIVAANWDSLVFDVGERPAAAGADDGTDAWNRGPRRYVVGRVHHAGRAARQTGLVTGGGEGLKDMAEREQKKKPAPPKREETVEEAPGQERERREDQGRARRSARRDRRGARDQRRGLREVLRPEGRRVAACRRAWAGRRNRAASLRRRDPADVHAGPRPRPRLRRAGPAASTRPAPRPRG